MLLQMMTYMVTWTPNLIRNDYLYGNLNLEVVKIFVRSGPGPYPGVMGRVLFSLDMKSGQS